MPGSRSLAKKDEIMSATVSIACKIPNGLTLRLFKMTEANELVMGGGSRSVKVAERIGGEVTIFGTAHPVNQAPKCLIVGGYAITPNVDKDFWDKWIKDNAELDMVKNKLIFAHEKQEMVAGKAKEQRLVRSNMGPLDPETKVNGKYADPRMPERVKKLDTAEQPDAM